MLHRLTKHHGLGNDFLVLLHDGDPPFDPATLAIDLCHRRRGVGADGLILGDLGSRRPPGVDVVMALYNADGSRAEMSGNGVRCLAQAETMRRGRPGPLRIATDAGVRAVDVAAGDTPGTVTASVDMGPATPGPADQPASRPATAGETTDITLAVHPKQRVTVDVGNPHLVLLVDDPEAVDVAAAGPLHEQPFPGGMNVHFVAPAPGEDDTLTMRVWERGVGATEACGTGAVAAARAAHDWALVGDHVVVRMPGGEVQVRVGEPMTLLGPATFVAAIEVDR